MSRYVVGLFFVLFENFDNVLVFVLSSQSNFRAVSLNVGFESGIAVVPCVKLCVCFGGDQFAYGVVNGLSVSYVNGRLRQLTAVKYQIDLGECNPFGIQRGIGINRQYGDCFTAEIFSCVPTAEFISVFGRCCGCIGFTLVNFLLFPVCPVHHQSDGESFVLGLRLYARNKEKTCDANDHEQTDQERFQILSHFGSSFNNVDEFFE